MVTGASGGFPVCGHFCCASASFSPLNFFRKSRVVSLLLVSRTVGFVSYQLCCRVACVRSSRHAPATDTGRSKPRHPKQGGINPGGTGPVFGQLGAEPVPQHMPQHPDQGERCPAQAGKPGVFVVCVHGHDRTSEPCNSILLCFIRCCCCCCFRTTTE